MIEPVRKLRIFVAMAARLLPGVRCSTLCTVYSSPSWRIVIPGRTCVARIPFAPDAYGILRQALVSAAFLRGAVRAGHNAITARHPQEFDYRRPLVQRSTRRARLGEPVLEERRKRSMRFEI